MCERVDEPSVNYYGVEYCDQVLRKAEALAKERAQTPGEWDTAADLQMERALDDAVSIVHRNQYEEEY